MDDAHTTTEAPISSPLLPTGIATGVLLALVAVIVVMLVAVVPGLTSTFEDMNAELPALTQIVIALSSRPLMLLCPSAVLVGGHGSLFWWCLRGGHKLLGWTVFVLSALGFAAIGAVMLWALYAPLFALSPNIE